MIRGKLTSRTHSLDEDYDMHDSRRRSLMKAMSWRLIAVIITTTVGYLFTENATFALSIGIADSIIKIFAYYLHERAWINAPIERAEPVVGYRPIAHDARTSST